jgi:peroxiredoxin
MMILTFVGTVFPWLVVSIGAWFIYRLVRQQGDILVRLNSIELELHRAATAAQRRHMKDGLAHYLLEQQRSSEEPPPNGLLAGTRAPDFELPDLSGERHKLQNFRGHKLLLIFFNPGCGPCIHLAPDLAKMPVDGANGHPIPVVITTGSADANRQLIAEHNLRCPVLLDAKGDIASLFKAAGTPSGYLIDEQGVLASPLTTAPLPLMDLLERALAHGHANSKGKEDRGLAASRLNRDGLKANTSAPHFRLPNLDGGELALEDLRGKPVLLVFSDPECAPCDALAPELERLHRQTPELQVVMISRREEEANRKKVAENSLTFPVLLQKQWEISKLYGIFATPVAYLIDANGVIIQDVAKGGPSILTLAAAPAQAGAVPFQARAA